MVAIGVGTFVTIWALSGLVDRIDKLPIIGGLLELVGLLVTGWFVYRYLVFGPDRWVAIPMPFLDLLQCQSPCSEHGDGAWPLPRSSIRIS